MRVTQPAVLVGNYDWVEKNSSRAPNTMRG